VGDGGVREVTEDSRSWKLWFEMSADQNHQGWVSLIAKLRLNFLAITALTRSLLALAINTSTSTTSATSTTSQSLRIINNIFQRLNPLHQSRPQAPRNRGGATTNGPQLVPWDPAVSGLNIRPEKDVQECFWLVSVTEDAKGSRGGGKGGGKGWPEVRKVRDAGMWRAWLEDRQTHEARRVGVSCRGSVTQKPRGLGSGLIHGNLRPHQHHLQPTHVETRSNRRQFGDVSAVLREIPSSNIANPIWTSPPPPFTIETLVISKRHPHPPSTTPTLPGTPSSSRPCPFPFPSRHQRPRAEQSSVRSFVPTDD
jgi:hypothetical protein